MNDELMVTENVKKQRPRERSPAFIIPMTKKKARANVAYMAIVTAVVGTEEQKGLLDLHGRFSKEEVLQQCGLVGLDFHWQILRDIIQDDYGEELYPVSASYFKRRREDEEPRKYLCQGHGKKTAGYVVARDNHEPVIKASLTLLKSQLEGGVKVFQKKRTNAVAHVDRIASAVEPLLLTKPGE